jgi:hypothetical protein
MNTNTFTSTDFFIAVMNSTYVDLLAGTSPGQIVVMFNDLNKVETQKWIAGLVAKMRNDCKNANSDISVSATIHTLYHAQRATAENKSLLQGAFETIKGVAVVMQYAELLGQYVNGTLKFQQLLHTSDTMLLSHLSDDIRVVFSPLQKLGRVLVGINLQRRNPEC